MNARRTTTLVAALAVLAVLLDTVRLITIGTLVANRTRSELEPLIGFFVMLQILPETKDRSLEELERELLKA